MKSNKLQWDFIIAIIRLFHPENVHINDDWGEVYTSVNNECPLIDLCEWAQRIECVNNYVDEYGRYHHKPVTELEPIPSNNGWIYTAYAAKVGLPIDRQKLLDCFVLCETYDNGVYRLIRSPDMPNPPISRDEILGLAELGLLSPANLDGWNFSPYPIPKFSLTKLIKQVSQLITTRPASAEGSWYKLWGPFYTRHRNHFWQNNLDQMYRFAFSVPLTDRHFILKSLNKFNLIYWAIARADSIFGKDTGIRYLKYGKSKTAMKTEFPADHPVQGA